MGLPRDKWSQAEYEIAYKKLDKMVEYIKKTLSNY